VAEIPTVARFNPTAESQNRSTVDMSPKPRVGVWITDDGLLIPAGRVKRIRLAQDVINPGEEAVYDNLWNARPLQPNGSDFRIVQVGYDYLVKRTRLAKKTIQRIIDKLLHKDFIAIERPADIYQRTPTVYRVFGYKTVLERHMQKGRAHVAKVGPGFSYVHEMAAPQPDRIDLSTVDRLHVSTVDRLYVPTVDKTTTETVVKKDLPTVVKMATSKIEHSEVEQTSSEVNQIAQTLRQAIGTADDDVARRLITECRRRAGDATVDEITEFLQQKARFAVRNPQIRNPTGFLLTAVPICFEGESFRNFRKGREESKQQEKAEMERIAKAILDDPESANEDRSWAREILGEWQYR
jgi:predicted transcriptional regulator